MSSPEFTAVILAAGLGTRMKSGLPKVLHEVLGRPMLFWAIDSALAAGAHSVVVVVGHGRQQVEELLTARYTHAPVTTAVQHRMLGTADAVQAASAHFSSDERPVLIMSGDAPNVRRRDIQDLLQLHLQERALVTITSADDHDEHHYGRIVRTSDGRVSGIVEYKDASPEQRAITEVNMGLYAADPAFLRSALARTNASNAAGEFYLTDIVSMAAADGAAHTLKADRIERFHGVNDRAQLARANAIARDARNLKLMQSGVTLVDPATTWIHGRAWVEPDCVLEPGVVLTGGTVIEAEAIVGAHAVLHDCRVGRGVYVEPGTVARGRQFA